MTSSEERDDTPTRLPPCPSTQAFTVFPSLHLARAWTTSRYTISSFPPSYGRQSGEGLACYLV